VMVVSREDTSMTPAGMTFSTLAGIAGGGNQTPGVMGVVSSTSSARNLFRLMEALSASSG